MVAKSKIDVFAEVIESDDEPVGLSGLVEMQLVTAIRRPESPARFLLGTLRDGRLRVRSPISVNLTTENDDFVAEADELDEFGFGKNPSEAIADLQKAIVELYFTLEMEAARLGPDLVSVRGALRSKVEQTHDRQSS